MLKHTGTFEAVGSDSETHTVLVFTNYIDARTMTDPHAVVAGLKELRTLGEKTGTFYFSIRCDEKSAVSYDSLSAGVNSAEWAGTVLS